MRRIFHVAGCAALFALLLVTGCVSERKAKLEQQQAYIAGQEQALKAAGINPNQPRKQVVFVQGPVRNPVVPWTEGMMLSQAIVTADYTGFMNPVLVRVIRAGQVVAEMKGIDLLHHEDASLEPGDVVQLIE